VIILIADAFSQIEEVRTDNNSASVHLTRATFRVSELL
jgi:hypothetical protein